MGMGNYANFAEVIQEEFVKEQCPETFQKLLDVLLEADYSLETLANSAQYDDLEGELTVDIFDEATIKKIVDAFDNLCNEFQEKIGLELMIKYHNAEDRGDEVNGVFWAVDGVYQLTPAAEKIKDKIERKFWTVFG